MFGWYSISRFGVGAIWNGCPIHKKRRMRDRFREKVMEKNQIPRATTTDCPTVIDDYKSLIKYNPCRY